MKSFTAIAAITLVAAVTARPSSRLVARQGSACILATEGNPATPQIAASINQWSADVNAFNDFLNQAYYLDPASLKSAASALFPNVEDESCQLGTLSGFLSGVSDAATCALGDLPNIYSTLEWTLNQLIADPTDNTNVQNSLEDINAYRCCNVLPDIDILWADAAGMAGIKGQVPAVAGRENLCAEIDCSAYEGLDGTKCASKDNNGLGK
ncbi:hypothetical protein LTR53_000246 [Teratosphaeriaceae sp. CCFEE 6253]|nr:hypothetical protein LTR53_000246 [Teratosphaeriaceae sp. CCFEE 6253]